MNLSPRQRRRLERSRELRLNAAREAVVKALGPGHEELATQALNSVRPGTEFQVAQRALKWLKANGHL